MDEVTAGEPAEVGRGINRGQFFRTAGKTGLVLATSGGVLALAEGVSYAKSDGDVQILQAAYTAESLAVFVYSTILDNFHKFKHPKLEDRDYFVAALRNEKDHKKFLGSALGSSKPTGLEFKIPRKYVKSGQALLETGVALETAFVRAYLGAVTAFSSSDLSLVAAQVAANEASHFSFLDAAAGGHGVLPSLPEPDTIDNTVKKLQPFIA